MQKILKVKPTLRNGKTLFDSINASLEYKAGGQDQIKKYDKATIVNSTILLRPQWNNSKRRYNNNLDEENLLKIVKNLRLRDTNNKLIESIDLYDMFDSTMNHEDLKLKIKQDSHIFDLDSNLDKLQLAFIEARDDVNTINNKNPRAKFNISNYEDKISVRKSELNEKSQAFVKISKLKVKEAAAYARALEIKVTEDNGLEFILGKLNEQAETNPKRTLKVLNLDKTELYIKDIIFKGINSRKIQYSTEVRGYVFEGEKVGTGRQDVFNYFTDPENQEFYIKLQKEVE